MNKRWKIAAPDEQTVAALHQSLKVTPVLCRLLAARGISHYDEAKNYFRPAIDLLHSPYLMKDMDKAVQRIEQAFNQKEKILVFGDYDVDGTTSVAMMYQFLYKIYEPALLDFYIPHRYREGYGISKMGD